MYSNNLTFSIFFSPCQESLDIFDTDKDGKISVDEYLGM